MMKDVFKTTYIFVLIQAALVIIYQVLQDTLLVDMEGSVRFFLFILLSSVHMVVALYIVNKKSNISLNYLKSLGILSLIYLPAPVISRLFWGILRNNFGTVDWTDDLIGLVVFAFAGLVPALIISIFFRNKKQLTADTSA